MTASSPPEPGATPKDEFGTIDDLDCRGRRVFLRLDPFVVDELRDGAAPGALAPAATVADPTAMATRQHGSLGQLLELGCRVVVGTHVTPQAARATGFSDVEALAARLSEHYAVEVLMPDECVGDATSRVLANLRQGQICVLPDLAQAPAEIKGDEAFARSLAAFVDAYVNDAFGACHLPYASIVKLPRLVPRRALGVRARRELHALRGLLAAPAGTTALVLGGQRFSQVIDFVELWLPRLRCLVATGSAASTLLAARGETPPADDTEPERLAQARSLLARARDLAVEVLLPVDLCVRASAGAPVRVVPARSAREHVVDLGPESTANVVRAVSAARHVLWWGPLGSLGEAGSAASRRLAETCAEPQIESVLMGSTMRRFVRQLAPPVQAGIGLVTSSSGAARAFLSGRRLPGLEPLRARH